MSTRSHGMEISGAADTDVAIAPPSTTRPGRPPQAPGRGEFSQEMKPSPTRVLPDPAVCRAKALGLADFADCLVEHPWECPHAVSFGFGYFCHHPERHEIVRQTAWHG